MQNPDENKQLEEMAQVFHLPKDVRFRYLWLPRHFPKLSQKLWEKKHGKAAGR